MDADLFAAKAVDLHARLTRVVLAMCGDRTLAEDSAQEALLRAWERVEAGEDLRSLEAWTITVALNWCRSQLRRTGAESRALERIAGSERPRVTVKSAPDLMQSENFGEDVHRAVLALAERQREVIVLHYLLDMDIASIAKVISRSQGAVKNALFHGRAALARELGGENARSAGRRETFDRDESPELSGSANRPEAPEPAAGDTESTDLTSSEETS